MHEEDAGAFRVETVAVIGAGTAGRAFALRCAQAGICVVLEDVMPSKLRRAQDEYADEAPGAAGLIQYANTVEDAVVNADLAIDFVPDELESKLEIFSMLDRMAPPRTVLCTPTTTLSVTDLASCTYRADRCIAVRWDGETRAELIESSFLNSYAKALTVDWLERLGFQVRVSADMQAPMLTRNSADVAVPEA